jgi:Tfp pilus assembly protein PilO
MSTTLRQSSWIVTLSLAAIAVVYVTFVWLPGRRAIQQISDNVEAKQALIAQSTGLSATLMRVQRELDETESAATQWEKAAPGKKDIPALYGKIDALAKGAHLAISRFDPQPFIVHEKLQEIPITMACSGTFAQICEFLRSVEQQSATIWVESIRLEKSVQNTKDVQCELSLVVFSNNPQSSDYARHTD